MQTLSEKQAITLGFDPLIKLAAVSYEPRGGILDLAVMLRMLWPDADEIPFRPGGSADVARLVPSCEAPVRESECRVLDRQSTEESEEVISVLAGGV